MKIIGCTGVARSGKDSVTNALISTFNENMPNLKVKRYAFADCLKRELDPMFIDLFGVSCTGLPDKLKSIYRPMLIAHGQIRRELTQNKYWIDKIKEQLSFEQPDVAIISDLRYTLGVNSEREWIKNEGGLIVHTKRFEIIQRVDKRLKKGYSETKEYIKPASDDEKYNDPVLEKEADFNIEWPTLGADLLVKEARERAKEFYHKFITKFI